MSHRTVQKLGVFVYSATGTEYDWTTRALGDKFSTVSETIEEDVLEFVHSDISVTLDDKDEVVSALLMAIGATDKWRCEIWRDPAMSTLVWSGTIDATTVSRDYSDETVTFTAYSHSKLLDLTSAEDVKRVITGITGTTTADSVNLTVNDGTELLIDDEVQMTQGTTKEKRRIATKSGNTFTVTEAWKTAFTAAPLTLETPYYRDKTPDFLARRLFEQAGIGVVNTRLDTLSIADPFPARMNSNGLTRRAVDCVSKRGSYIAVFENLASYYASNPTVGFTAGSYTPVQPSDWTPYTGTEPGTNFNIGAQDNGEYVTGNQSTYKFYLGVFSQAGPSFTTDYLRIYNNNGTTTNYQDVASSQWNNESGDNPTWETSLEYNATESRLWVSYKATKWDGSAGPSGCKAYTTTLGDGTTRPVTGGNKLRFAYVGPHMVEFGANYINLRAAATPYGTAGILEHRGNLVSWTFRRIYFDSKTYFCCIQRRDAATFGKYEWYLILWDYTTGAVVTETKITEGYALSRCYGSVWYDPVGVDDVYTGYVELEEVGGMYFYLTKSTSISIPYADFKGKSCAEAMRELAMSTGSIIWVDRNKQGYFIGRNSLAAQFNAAPVTISDPIKKVRKRFWEWYRTSCLVTGRSPVTDIEFKELAGDTGNTQWRIEVDASFVSTPGLARALAQNYVNFLDNANSQYDVVVVEPTSGPVVLFNRVTLDAVTYRVLRTQNDYSVGEQALTLVQD